jgi:lipopolysaccharide transport system ATP-binding protein
MTAAIQVDQVSKRYRIGHFGPRGRAPYHTLQETIVDAVKAPFKRIFNPTVQGKVSDFWALRNVSFGVDPGDVIGIVGRNGAGKSTLLKILTRITEPTSGRAVLRGRVGSLLEVGTGFHPELSGRENIFLNGAIMGMSRFEIRRQFDQIVDFSGVETFLDTPVKRYSSGMRVRLAFSVAAHLNPEILLIDEVLAVGDAGFQRKCLGKMGDVARSGRTILFVSHNMAALQNLCNRGLFIEGGQVAGEGKMEDVIGQYLSMFESGAGSRDLTDVAEQRRGSGEARFSKIELLNDRGEPATGFPMGAGMTLRARVHALKDLSEATVAFAIVTKDGVRVASMNSEVMESVALDVFTENEVVVECALSFLNLMPGPYYVDIILRDSQKSPVDVLDQIVSFDVLESNVFGTGRIPISESMVYFHGKWTVQ